MDRMEVPPGLGRHGGEDWRRALDDQRGSGMGVRDQRDRTGVLVRPLYLTFCSEMPGAGRFAPNRNKAIMAPVNSSFLRRSGVRNARTNTLSTAVALG
jgi:hypothetical protein